MAALDVLDVKSTASGGADANTRSVTFDATPNDGDLLLLFVRRSSSSSTVTPPSGFTTFFDTTGGQRTLCVYAKVAASEASATYSITTTSDTRATAYRIEGPFSDLSTVTVDDNGDTTAVSSRTILTSGVVSVVDNTLVIAALSIINFNNTSTFTNSFGNATKVTRSTASGTLETARRFYATAAADVQTIPSWVDASGTHSALVRIATPSAPSGPSAAAIDDYLRLTGLIP